MSAVQAAGIHCALSESCVGTTTHRRSCDSGMLALWLESESCREFPPGLDFLTRCRHIGTNQSLGSSSACPALLVRDSLSLPLDLFLPVTSRSTRLPEFFPKTDLLAGRKSHLLGRHLSAPISIGPLRLLSLNTT